MMRTPAEELEALTRDQREHLLKYVSNDVNAYVLMPRERDPSSVYLADIRPGSDLRLHDGPLPEPVKVTIGGAPLDDEPIRTLDSGDDR